MKALSLVTFQLLSELLPYLEENLKSITKDKSSWIENELITIKQELLQDCEELYARIRKLFKIK